MPNTPFADLPHRQDGDGPLDARTPEGVLPAERLADAPAAPDPSDVAAVESTDPADQIPVPIVMSAAEIDERAQAVEAVRENRDLEPRIDV